MGKRTFSAEYREEAVKMVLETGRPIAAVARDLEMTEGTLGNWGVPRTQKRVAVGGSLGGAVQMMKGCGPSASPCGGRRQTTSSCVG